MKKSIAKHYLELCADSHKEKKERQKFELPDWLDLIKNDKSTAEKSFVTLESVVLMLAHRKEDVLNNYPGMGLCKEMPLAECFRAWSNFVELKGNIESYSPLKSTFESLARYSKYVHSEFVGADAKEPYTSKSLHELATEALQREAACATPMDVSDLMLSEAGAVQQIDVFALDGLGLLYSARRKAKTNLVGDDFGKAEEGAWPTPLRKTNKDSLTWFRNSEFVNKQFIDLEWLFGEHHPQGEALLVNATKIEMPFLNGDKENDQAPGSINSCLTAGYKKVVVLVSNHYLTAGRGMADQILMFCIKHGLIKVIQLPMGVLGFKSQQHSILVFEPGPNNRSIEFIDLSAEMNTKEANKGFGEPRRAKALKSNGDGHWGPNYVEERATVEVSSLWKRPGSSNKKLLSFEVGQFLKVDPLKDLRSSYTFIRIQEFMNVFRSHHIEQIDEGVRIEYSEIGANCISEFGWVSEGRKRDAASEALDKRKAQILKDKDIVLCFRGAPDSFGKAGLYRKRNNEIAVPNQSFVILRMKDGRTENAPHPELVMWWIRSTFAQNYLKQKSISPDVVRVSPKDIATLEVPCGPYDLIAREEQKIQKSNEILFEMELLRQSVSQLDQTAWSTENSSSNRG